jgi:hypothetical protein
VSDETTDPLASWPRFVCAVRDRLEQGRKAYGETSFNRSPDELLAELQQEALDLAGWGFVLYRRIEAMRAAIGDRVTLSDPSQIATFHPMVFWRYCRTCQVTIEHHGPGGKEACPVCQTPWPKPKGDMREVITGIARDAGLLTVSGDDK